VNHAGFKSCYIPGFKSKHIGIGDNDSGEYRQMKNDSLQQNLPLLNDRCANYILRGLIEPLPQMREPLDEDNTYGGK